MPVQFVIGRAGSGKTHYCLERIRRACIADPLGGMIFWILPRQATFTAERALVCESGLDAIARVQVVSFEQLQREILADAGGVAIPQISSFGRRAILGHLLREHASELRAFKTVAGRPGLARELDSTFSELERSGVSIDELVTSIADIQTPLADKIHDLHRIHVAYEAFRGQDRLDASRRIEKVIERINDSHLVRSSTILVDGFHEFTSHERQILVALAKSSVEIKITFTFDPHAKVLNDPHWIAPDTSIFRRTQAGYRQIYLAMNEGEVVIEPPHLLRENQRTQQAELLKIEELLGSDDRGDAIDLKSDRVTFVECADRRAEVFAAARFIRNQLLEGMRLRDFVVLSRDLNDYRQLIELVFRESGIAFFVDHRRPASHHPLVQFVRSLPDLILRNWSHDTVVSLLKSGLLPVPGEDPLSCADELENYAIEHRITGRAWIAPQPWSFSRKRSKHEEDDGSPDREAARMNEMRVIALAPLMPLVDAFREPKAVKSNVAALRRTLELAQVRKTMNTWIADAIKTGQLEDSAEHEQAWNQLDSLLDELVELLGDTVVSAEHFAQVLESGLEEFDLAIAPPTIDQVLVGDLDRTRTIHVKTAIVMGFAEGQFPSRPGEDSVFADSDRQALRARHHDLTPDSRIQLRDERFLAYLALTRASENVCITRPVGDADGHELGASLFWHELRSAIPNARVVRIPVEHELEPAHICTPRQLVTNLARWARDANASPPEFGALYERLRNCSDLSSLVLTREIGWQALTYRNDATLSPEMAAALFPAPLNSSVSRIESFATCPFKHFSRYGLKLEQRSDDEVNVMDLGNIYHGVLESIVGDITREKQSWKAIPRDQLAGKIRRAAQSIGASLREELMLSSARNRYILAHIETTVAEVIEAQSAAASHGKFVPRAVEVDFGPSPAQLPPLTIESPKGNLLNLRGRMDRVDVLARDAAVAVIDYKLSGSQLELQNVYHGISLQLLTYLLVLERTGTALVGTAPTAAAAFFVKLLRQLEPVAHPSEALSPTDPLFHLQVKPRGIFDGAYLDDIDASLTEGPSDVVSASINKSGEFGHRDKTDVVSAEELRGVLNLVERKIGELADQIISGDISITPYIMGQVTPCPRCDFRAVCRFDPITNHYRRLQTMKRTDVLAQCVNGGAT